MSLVENIVGRGMHAVEHGENLASRALRTMVHSQIDRSLGWNWPKQQGVGHRLITTGLLDMGFDQHHAKDFLDMHFLASKGKLFSSVGPANLMDDFRAAAALERKMNGAPQMLNEKFGIRSFGEFPVEALEEQAKNMQDKKKPYVLALRQATLSYDSPIIGKTGINQKIYEQAKQLGAIVRFAEFRTPYEFWKRINVMHQLFGSDSIGKELGNVILLHHDAHGNIGLLGFESSKIHPEARRSISMREALKSNALTRLGEMLPNDCPIILASCKGGFSSKPGTTLSNAEIIATMTGHPVYASPIDSAVSSNNVTLLRSDSGSVTVDYSFEVTLDDLSHMIVKAQVFQPSKLRDSLSNLSQ